VAVPGFDATVPPLDPHDRLSHSTIVFSAHENLLWIQSAVPIDNKSNRTFTSLGHGFSW
jgi:hypothetical protein